MRKITAEEKIKDIVQACELYKQAGELIEKADKLISKAESYSCSWEMQHLKGIHTDSEVEQ